MPIKTSLSIIVSCALIFTGPVYYYQIPASDLVTVGFYESLANPSVRIVRVEQGERQEEIANTLAESLGWSSAEKLTFMNAPIAFGTDSLEGKYFPSTYLLNEHDSPVGITATMIGKFQSETKDIKKAKTTKVVNQDTALKIASIIQREAAGNGDMRLISGIIWNRLFKGMKLQIDATLQYAKGDSTDWWPEVTPDDKSLESPYNTYIHTDLPPTPISNPGIEAISAAYNPQPTNCLFYIHDKNRTIHCSATYQGQLSNVAKYY